MGNFKYWCISFIGLAALFAVESRAIVNVVGSAKFTNYSTNRQPEIMARKTITAFNSFSAATQGKLNLKLNGTRFQTYSGNRATQYGYYKTVTAFNSYSTANGSNKQAKLAGTGFVKSTAGTISYDNSTYLTTTGSAASLTGFPVLNQNTSGTAANLSGTPALPNGATATTQTAADNSTKLATTAYVDSGLSGKQATLVSATNIKTINGSSILGAGDLVVTGGGGGTPATTVVTETTYGQSSAVGVATNYAREDHTHGTVPSTKDTTAVTGLLKGDGTTIAAATAGTDYLTPSGSAASLTSFPTLNQDTTGSAAKWTTARALAGNSVDGSVDATFANKFIVQGTADTGLTQAQFLGALGSGILKNTTTSGLLSIATGADLPTMSATVGGAVPTPPNSATQYLNGAGTFSTPASSGIGSIVKMSNWSTVTATQQTAQSVTGMSWSIAAATQQVFRCVLAVANRVATTGIRFSFNGPAITTAEKLASVSHVDYVVGYPTSTTAKGFWNMSTLNTTSLSPRVTSGLPLRSVVQIDGVIRSGAASGTVQLQGASSAAVGTVKVLSGSFCEVY